MGSKNNLILVVCAMFLVTFIHNTKAQTVFNSCTQLTTFIVCSTANQNQFPTRNTTGTISTTFASVTLGNQNFAAITDGGFGGLTIIELGFTSNNLQSIGDNAFTGATSIAKISFNEASLASISTNAFNPIKSSLTELSFLSSGITVTRMNTLKEGFQILNTLTTLTLDTNSLITISSGWLTGLTGLQTLSVKSNQLAGIDATAFSTNAALKSIDLTSNQLTDMSQLITALTPLTNVLESLTLTSNQFTSVVDFPAFPKLLTLDLSSNMIASLASDNTFVNLPALTSIVLSNNQLTVVPKITNQNTLLTLTFKNQTSFTTLPANSFYRTSTPTAGVNVNLDGNTIGTFDVKAFCSGQGPYYSQVVVTFDSVANFNKCSFKQMKNDNTGLRTNFFVVEKTGVTDYTSFCNCENKVFANNNQVDLTGACASFTDACSTTTYTDNCAADYTCARITTTTSASPIIRFEYLGLIVTNLIILISVRQF